MEKVPSLIELLTAERKKTQKYFILVFILTIILFISTILIINLNYIPPEHLETIQSKTAIREDTTRWTYFVWYKDGENKMHNNLLYISKPIEKVEDIQNIEVKHKIKIENIQLLKEPKVAK